MSVEDATALAHRIGREVAAIHAADVDVQARFPKETIDAFRAEGLLGALVPTELGGLGHDLRTAAAVVRDGRPLLRVLGDDPGDAPHPGGLPGPARPLGAAARLRPPRGGRPAAAGLGHHRDRHRRQHPLLDLLRRAGRRRRVHPDQAGAGHLLRRVRRRDLHHRAARRGQPAERPGPRGLRDPRGDPDPAQWLGHPRLPRHLLARLHPRGERRRRAHPRRPVRRHLRPDDAADRAPALVLAVARPGRGGLVAGPAVRPEGRPQGPRHHAPRAPSGWPR